MKKERKVFYGWWIVAGCVVITATMVPMIVSQFGKYALAVTDELGISRSQFMLANTIVQLTGIILSPYISKMMISGKMKLMQTVGVIGFCLSYFTYSLAQNIFQFYLSSIFVGIFFWGATMLPVTYMVTMWFKEKRGLAMSVAMAGIGIGGTIFSQVITASLEAFGWRSTYQLMAGIILVAALPIVMFVLKSEPAEKGLTALGEKSEKVNAIKPVSEANFSVNESFKKVFFGLIVLGMFLNGLVNMGALSNFPAAIQEMYNATTSANIISIYSFVGIFGKLILGWINDRFGVVASSIFGCAGFIIAFILLLVSQNITTMYLMAVSFGLGTPIGSVLPPLITASVYGQKNYAKAFGIMNSVGTLGTAVGSLVVASILDVTGSYHTAWFVLIIFTVTILISWVLSYTTSRQYFTTENPDITRSEIH